MNELQVKYFLETVESGSITQAAKNLFVSRPAVSKQISELEKELGVPLFERKNNMVVLTKGGKLFYDCFVQIRRNIENTAVMARKSMGADDEPRMFARLAFFISWDINFFMSPLLSQLKKSVPSCGLNLKAGASSR